jgi:hypothetical protein
LCGLPGRPRRQDDVIRLGVSVYRTVAHDDGGGVVLEWGWPRHEAWPYGCLQVAQNCSGWNTAQHCFGFIIAQAPGPHPPWLAASLRASSMCGDWAGIDASWVLLSITKYWGAGVHSSCGMWNQGTVLRGLPQHSGCVMDRYSRVFGGPVESDHSLARTRMRQL